MCVNWNSHAMCSQGRRYKGLSFMIWSRANTWRVLLVLKLSQFTAFFLCFSLFPCRRPEIKHNLRDFVCTRFPSLPQAGGSHSVFHSLAWKSDTHSYHFPRTNCLQQALAKTPWFSLKCEWKLRQVFKFFPTWRFSWPVWGLIYFLVICVSSLFLKPLL